MADCKMIDPLTLFKEKLVVAAAAVIQLTMLNCVTTVTPTSFCHYNGSSANSVVDRYNAVLF